MASKGFMKAFIIKPAEALQRSLKIKIYINFFSASGIGAGKIKLLNTILP